MYVHKDHHQKFEVSILIWSCVSLLFSMAFLAGCSTISESDSGPSYRPTATDIRFDQLPKRVIARVNEDLSNLNVTRVQKWGESPNHYFVIEFDGEETIAYKPDGKQTRHRVPGGIL